MDLKTFVSETLVQIVDGVSEAQARIEKSGVAAAINPSSIAADSPRDHGSASPVEFDVAVVVSEESSEASGEKAKAAAGLISVVSLRAAGELESGRAAGARNETSSRIRFTVQLAQPGSVHRHQRPRVPPQKGSWMA
ncbi:MAG: hypothetical protein ACM3IG_02330 [Myxococcales bacterium]|jgi:hypothetical protein